jgi:anti-anti-sigma factor
MLRKPLGLILNAGSARTISTALLATAQRARDLHGASIVNGGGVSFLMASSEDRPDEAKAGLQLTVSHQGTTGTLELVGELDVAQDERVRTALKAVLDEKPESLVLDLSKLSFIDSTGIGIVIGLKKAAERDGVRLVICRGPLVVQRVFELTGLTSSLPFVPSVGGDSR